MNGSTESIIRTPCVAFERQRRAVVAYCRLAAERYLLQVSARFRADDEDRTVTGSA
jgi:hypothetical protein